MFGADNPAENIEELVKYLNDSHTDEYYYRGQNKYYEVAVPSSLRKFVLPNKKSNNDWIDLDGMKLEFPDRIRAKSWLGHRIIMAFGKGLGNMINQQYGISSDAFDITSDPVIAGFFATRSYPTYDHYQPLDSENIGVIYRLKIPNKNPPRLEVMEQTLNSLYTFAGDNKSKIWFSEVSSLRHRILKGELLESNAIEDYLNSRFPKDHISHNLLRQAGYLPYSLIESAFLEKAGEIGLSDALDIIRSSRTFRQKGGIYFPPTMHSTFISKHIEIFPLNKRDFYARPATVESNGAINVFNLNANPFVKTYFFKHNSSIQIEIDDLALLWPSEKEDFLLSLIRHLTEDKLEKYLKDKNVDVFDFDQGIIDPGYKVK